MAQTPSIIAVTAMQRLKETGQAPTPENFTRMYYEISGLPPPDPAHAPAAAEAAPAINCVEVMNALREMMQDMSDKAGRLADDLGSQQENLSSSVNTLKQSRDKHEILRLLSTVVMQAGGIQKTVESSHRELQEAKYALTNMQNELAETRQLLNEDALTGALNRRGLDQNLAREVARCQRNQSKLSLAMVDLDHFKKVNDTYGHAVGDLMLVHFATLIRAVLRKSDALVRYGGEEFTLILPETDARGGFLVLGRLQQLLKKTPLMSEGRQVPATFSAGIAQLRDDENGHALLRRADEALYKAKAAGRDRILIAE